VYDYAGRRMVFHGGAGQGYRGVVAMLPDQDLGIALLWNSESSLPTGMLPTIVDRALGLTGQRWLDVDFDEPSLYAQSTSPSQATPPAQAIAPGVSANKANAAPR